MRSIVVASLLLFIASTGVAGPAEILLIGTYHFANPGKDVVNVETDDILSEKRQKEVARVAEALMRFRPNKVMLEASWAQWDTISGQYERYRLEEHELTANERQQLGFRVARQMGVDYLALVDVPGEFPLDSVLVYAAEKDEDYIAYFESTKKELEERSAEMQKSMTVAQILREMNNPENIAKSNEWYTETAKVGGGETFVGAHLASSWYDRNVRIFANIAQNTLNSDRVLIIYGAGHLYHLRQLIESSPDMELLDPMEYLPEK